MNNTPDFDLSDIRHNPREQEKIILKWEAYYLKQKVIITVTPTTDIFQLLEICNTVKVRQEDVAFAVLLPLTFFHLPDFKSNVKNAITRFCFMKNGQVATEESTGLKTITYGKAFIEIAKRVTGTDISKIIPPVTTANLLTEEEEKLLSQKEENFKNALNLWMEKFRKLPAVESVEPYTGGYPGDLVEIKVKTNFPMNDCLDFYTLHLGDKIRHIPYYDEGEPSTLYENWCDTWDLSNTSYEEFYLALVNLSNQYVNVPQA